jgi:tripeptidyl-peptidase-1
MSSGDGGVGGSQPTQCTIFVPTFPSTCPFVTSIGATDGLGPEIAADFSSGGFSNFLAQPSYQTAAVSSFLSRLGSTYSGLFNPAGRAFPDISAQGTNIPIVFGQELGLVGGTSASTPIMASITALLNDQLIARGQPPVGFINPLIYSSGGSAFTDITAGTNPGCGTAGFNATTGWDPVTGFGTPVFSRLQTLFGL